MDGRTGRLRSAYCPIIRGRLIDLVVVYKVDRLTHSLADFAKMVETFDAHRLSFVAVTCIGGRRRPYRAR
jgi:DNA invertase Pin-like site-specific DNA recombinase